MENQPNPTHPVVRIDRESVAAQGNSMIAALNSMRESARSTGQWMGRVLVKRFPAR